MQTIFQMILIEAPLLAYFLFTTTYAFIFFVASKFYRDKKFNNIQNNTPSRFCVFIPAYKEDGVIVSVAKSAREQNYPKDKFHVVVIADSLKDETVEQLKKLDITALVVKFDVSTKVKSLNQAFSSITDPFDFAVILDADNIMEPDFLWKVNHLHHLGYSAIQTQRAPKNSTSSVSILDGLSEGINYNLVSKSGIVLNASPGIKGSGMSFDFQLLKNSLAAMESVGGFDRELELRLLEQNVDIYYSSDTLIFDEKVENMEVLKKQRTRWISSQYIYLARYFSKGVKELFKGNFSYFNSSVVRNIQLPRLINTGLLFSFTLIFIIIHQYTTFGAMIWIILAALNAFILFFSIPKSLLSKKLFMAILSLPMVFVQMFLLLFKLKGANKKFIHTPHQVNNHK